MDRPSLAFASAFQQAAWIRTGALSPVELVDELLQRIARLNPLLSAYLTVVESEVRVAARAAETAVVQGAALGPLHGVPVALKDLEFTKGIRTTGGSLVFRDFMPDQDAVIVERLKQAGALILGKTNTPEFGSYGEVCNRLGDDCRTPWDLERTSGGSSGGTAVAVAAGLAPMGTGTDGAGSIRVPASFCGVYGLKPTYGLVPQYGSFLAAPLYTVTGPVARTVRDAALMLSVIAGHDPRDPTSRRRTPQASWDDLNFPAAKLRCAWSPDLGLGPVDPEVRVITASAARVFSELGAVVEEATPPIAGVFPGVEEPIRDADKYAALGHLLEARGNDLTPYFRRVLERGRVVTGKQYSDALRLIERLRARVADFFERYDLLLTPTTPVTAFPLRRPPQTIDGHGVPPYAATTLHTVLANLTGQPAASVPCGFSSEGLPVGLQIMGRPGEDLLLLQASAAFEAVRPWQGSIPPLAAS